MLLKLAIRVSAFVLFAFTVNAYEAKLVEKDEKIRQIQEVVEQKEKEKDILADQIKELQSGIRVVVTMYRPVAKETDSTPNILADNTEIQTGIASQYRYISVSRNLLTSNGGPFKLGDFVIITNAGHKNGVYQIRDLMNSRFINKVDILEDKLSADFYKYDKAQIRKADWIL